MRETEVAVTCDVCGLPPAGVAEFVQVRARPRDSVCWRKQSEVAACNARGVERLKADNASLQRELDEMLDRHSECLPANSKAWNEEMDRLTARVEGRAAHEATKDKLHAAEKQNASLLESLRAAEKEKEALYDVSGSVACVHHDARGPLECVFCKSWAIRLAAAEQRAEAAEKALRSIIIRCREGDKRTDWLPIIDGIARAALHDEERSAPQEGRCALCPDCPPNCGCQHDPI